MGSDVVEQFRELQKRNEHISKQMKGLLNNFSDRLVNLEERILPLHHETASLQVHQRNLESAIKQLTGVMEFYRTPHEMSKIILKPTIDSVPEYIQAMKSIQNAQQYFKENSSALPELKKLDECFAKGNDNLCRYFTSELGRFSEDVMPSAELKVLVDAFINKEFEDPIQDGDLIPEDKVSDLHEVAFWLCRVNLESYDFSVQYAVNRSNALVKVLTVFVEKFRSSSSESSQMSTGSSAQRNVPHIPRRKKRSKATRNITVNPSLHIDSALVSKRTTFLSTLDLDDFDTSLYINLIAAFHIMSGLERKLLEKIIPRNKEKECFKRLCQDAMVRIMCDSEDVCRLCVQRSRSMRSDFSPVPYLLPIAHFLRELLPTGSPHVLTDDWVSSQYRAVFRLLLNSIQSCLNDFVEGVKGDSGKSVPADATVHEISSKVISTLPYLVYYREVLTLASYTQQDKSKSDGPENVLAKLNEQAVYSALDKFVGRLFGNLALALAQKSGLYDQPAKHALFRLNNSNYILKSIQSSNIVDFKLPRVEQTITDMSRHVSQARLEFMQSWRKLYNLLTKPRDNPIIAPADLASYQEKARAGLQPKMKEMDREAVKSIFADFNMEFQRVHSAHRTYAIPDAEILASVMNEIQSSVLEEYRKVHSDYAILPFTKFPEKYVKYTPVQLEACINECYALH